MKNLKTLISLLAFATMAQEVAAQEQKEAAPANDSILTECKCVKAFGKSKLLAVRAVQTKNDTTKVLRRNLTSKAVTFIKNADTSKVTGGDFGYKAVNRETDIVKVKGEEMPEYLTLMMDDVLNTGKKTCEKSEDGKGWKPFALKEETYKALESIFAKGPKQ